MTRVPGRAFGSGLNGVGALLVLAVVSCAGTRGTIGAVLSQDHDGRLIVRETPGGLAAARAGVEPGDEVLLIDGNDARAMSSREVHEVLSGTVGEPVKLTLVRDGEIVRVTLKRTPARKHSISRP